MSASPEDWLDAIKRIALTDPKRAWLRAHLDAPDCTATEAALAERAGQPIEAYRALATELAVAMEVDPPADPLLLLAEPAGDQAGASARRSPSASARIG